jgi:Domain of unknown function (DUF4252)
VKRSVLFLSLLSLSSLLMGCAGGSPSVDTVRWEIQRRFPEARFEPEEHFHLGRVKMGLLRGLVRMVPGKVDGQEFLSRIHGVEVASYNVRSLPDLDRLGDETRFESQLARAGWSLAIRTREENERVWMFVRAAEDGGLRNLFVVNLESDELTLVRIDGRIDQALAQAIAAQPKKAVATMKGEDEEAEPAGP